MKADILKAAKADNIPEGSSGLWYIRKFKLSQNLLTKRSDGSLVEVPAGHYTNLYKMTMATLHHSPPGELVMHDVPAELKTHLNFMLKARGRVLINGLGLGCVARGCLANPNVREVTVVERDRDVLKLVGRYMPKVRRFRLVWADALSFTKKMNSRFDCAWHDLWSDSDRNEEHLHVLHGALLKECARKVRFQGAWSFPQDMKRIWRRTVDLELV